MSKIEIEISENINKIIINDNMFIDLIRTSSYNFFNVYQISDNMLISYLDHFDKEVLMSQPLSEYVVKHMLRIGYIKHNDITNLSMSTYANLSTRFINEYKDYINIDKILSIKISTDSMKLEDLDHYDISDISKSTWNVISTCNLSKEFLTKNVKNINWQIFFETNDITNDIREQFEDNYNQYYIDKVNNNSNVNFNNAMVSEKISEMSMEDFEQLMPNNNN